jgi:hypothetical protein
MATVTHPGFYESERNPPTRLDSMATLQEQIG